MRYLKRWEKTNAHTIDLNIYTVILKIKKCQQKLSNRSKSMLIIRKRKDFMMNSSKRLGNIKGNDYMRNMEWKLNR